MESNSKDFGEFFDAKRANRHQEALEQALRKFSFLLIDSQQRSLVCFIQTVWQVS